MSSGNGLLPRTPKPTPEHKDPFAFDEPEQLRGTGAGAASLGSAPKAKAGRGTPAPTPASQKTPAAGKPRGKPAAASKGGGGGGKKAAAPASTPRDASVFDFPDEPDEEEEHAHALRRFRNSLGLV